MNLPPFEWFMLGAAAGWVVCALCFWIISAWREAPSLIMMDDAQLTKHASAVKTEMLYRFPSQFSGGTERE